ncbi:hypothetical protein OAQ99_04425 [Candidatus Kapabacteria bacterium]|nr:hypothetical protein [Candidatus Kapabacteria bacterium]
MKFKDSFDANEWETLQFSLMWVFRGVAGADGKIDKEEQSALTKLIKSHTKIPFAFTKEILESLDSNPGSFFRKSIVDSRDYRKGLEESAEILDSKISLDEALLYKKFLTAVGIFVANASGDDSESNKISDEEVDQLSKLAFHLKLKMTELKEEPTIDQIIAYIS